MQWQGRSSGMGVTSSHNSQSGGQGGQCVHRSGAGIHYQQKMTFFSSTQQVFLVVIENITDISPPNGHRFTPILHPLNPF